MVETSPAPESDPHAARAFAAVLGDGEHVLWAGRPDARRFVRADRRLVVLGVFWTAVSGAGFWGFARTLLGDEFAGLSVAVRVLVLVVAALPFAAVAVFCLGGHVLVRRRARERTAYAVTTRRVLVRRPALGLVGPQTLRELARDAVGEIVVEELRHGAGSLDVHDARSVAEPLRLEAIAQAEAVARRIRE